MLPLALSSGAGAMSCIAIGTTVLGGMFAATALAICYVSLFFVLLRRLFRRRVREAEAWADDAVPRHAE